METSNWRGLFTAVSPYLVPDGGAVRQNNLQIRRPGSLTPRPGLEQFFTSNLKPFLALYRKAYGGSTPDSLLAWKTADGINGDPTPAGNGYALYDISYQTVDGVTQLAERSVFQTTTTPAGRPSFCEDRHGTVYAFFGSGIRPQAYRIGVDQKTVDFGLDASTVAPTVTPSGDGWFIERVDVLSSGTSYYTAPTLTVSGGGPTRNATLRAVVQAGSIVAVDVVDGGSNFVGVPTITVSNEQIGTGFAGKGVVASTNPTFGFDGATSGTLTTAGYVSTRTHSYSVAGAAPRIAYKVTGGTAFVDASFDPISATYTALIPLTSASGTDAFAQVKFSPLSAAYKVGDSPPTGFAATTTYTTQILNTATNVQFQSRREEWYTSSDYFQNSYTPTAASIPNRFTYVWYANRDKFWALGPYPYRYVFTKSQMIEVGITPDDWLGNNQPIRRWGDYFFPDYRYISYYLLTGPENGIDTESNWAIASVIVQVDGNGRPFIDVPLAPAKKTDGSSYQAQPGTTYPTVRFYLSYCPDSWTLSNTGYPTSATYGNRWTPQSGQDRRPNFSDTDYSPASTNSGANVSALFANPGADSLTRWWGQGRAQGLPFARPIHDFRTTANGSTVGIAAGTVAVLSPGALLPQGVKFAIRFYQFNAYDYIVEERAANVGWLNSYVGDARAYAPRGASQWRDNRRNALSTTFTDFYFMAGEIDSTSSGGLSLLLPGAVKTGADAPKATITGRGWTATGQTATFTLRQQAPPFADGGTATFTDSDTYTFTTVQLVPAVSGKRIGSVTILSGGQNYYREPTILNTGGSGYGLRLGATVSGGKVTNVAVLDGGDGFTSDTILYTDVQSAKLLPVLRGTMRGAYRCAYRFADYSATDVLATTYTTANPLNGSKTITLASAAGVKPGMVVTGATGLRHKVKIVSLNGTTAVLSHEPTAVASAQPCVIRDMTKPVTYSDFSPIADVTADVNGSGRASVMRWDLGGVAAPNRADHVEFFRTSSDQSLVFYRLEMYGTVTNGVITLSDSSTDGLSDEELFDIDRPNYAALPVVLPNGGLNAYRFGTARSDMAVAVAWQDRLWYGVTTSGDDSNTVFFSEYDEFESCPDANELPIQTNLRTTDFLTALIPFGHLLMAMQNLHCYSINYNTDPAVDAVINLVAHRGAFSQNCWDIFDELVYAADERGIYSMSQSGEVEVLSDPVRNYFDDNLLDLGDKQHFHLKVDNNTGILRFFTVLAGSANTTYPHFALCYHIRNKAWWTESWPTALLCSTDYRRANQPDAALYGTVDGHIHTMSGRRDVAYRDIYSVTVTNPGSGYTGRPLITIGGTNTVGAADLFAVVQDGQVTEVLILYGGWGYGQINDDGNGNPVFDPNVTLTFSGGSGNGAAATALARVPIINTSTNEYSKTSVPFAIRTGAMAINNDENTRGGDRLTDRSVTVNYQPTGQNHILLLREYFNNSGTPRRNVMRRDRGTGFVHDTTGSKTTLDMIISRSALGGATGIATAMFAGRSLTDLASSDRHLAVELSHEPRSANVGEPPVPAVTIYSLEVRGVDGKQ